MSSFTDTFGGGVVNPADNSFRAVSLTTDTTFEWPLANADAANVMARIMDVTPGGAYAMTLPDATLVSKGESVLINNLGASTITVKDSAGSTLLSITAGNAHFLYLYDNSTAAGSWRSFQMGASTAQAQASTLAGKGLQANGATLEQDSPVTTTSSSPVALATSDRAQTYVWEGGLGTLTLPSCAAATDGWFVEVRNGGTGTLTIDPDGSETINDVATFPLDPGDSAKLITDGNEWWTVGLGRDAIFAFDYTSIDLDGLSGTYTLSGSELNRVAYKLIGALAGDVTLVVPASYQQYWIEDATTGAPYTVSVKADGGSALLGLTRGTRAIFFCNATELVKADTSVSISPPLSVANGGTGGTTVAAARASLSAAQLGANADITSLSALADGSAAAPTLEFSKGGLTGDVGFYAAGSLISGGTIWLTAGVSFGVGGTEYIRFTAAALSTENGANIESDGDVYAAGDIAAAGRGRFAGALSAGPVNILLPDDYPFFVSTAGDVYADGDAVVVGTLDVSGTASFASVQATGSVIANGAAIVNSAQLTTTLYVGGAFTYAGHDSGIPATAASTGTKGQIMFNGSYIYLCTATNTWVRAAVATW